MQNNTECKLKLKKKKKKEAGKGSEAVKTPYPVTPVWDTEASSHKRILGARVRTHSSVPLGGWLSWDMYTLTLLVTVWRLFLRTKSRFWWPKSATDYKMQCLACDLNMYDMLIIISFIQAITILQQPWELDTVILISQMRKTLTQKMAYRSSIFSNSNALMGMKWSALM